jgi:hypothetical protein
MVRKTKRLLQVEIATDIEFKYKSSLDTVSGVKIRNAQGKLHFLHIYYKVKLDSAYME